MAGQGRHCGPVTTRVEALVRALYRSCFVRLLASPGLPAELPVGVSEQGARWEVRITQALPGDGRAQFFLGRWKKKEGLRSWIRT